MLLYFFSLLLVWDCVSIARTSPWSMAQLKGLRGDKRISDIPVLTILLSLHNETVMTWARIRESMLVWPCLVWPWVSPMFGWIFVSSFHPLYRRTFTRVPDGLKTYFLGIFPFLDWFNHMTFPFPSSLTSCHLRYLAAVVISRVPLCPDICWSEWSWKYFICW